MVGHVLGRLRTAAPLSFPGQSRAMARKLVLLMLMLPSMASAGFGKKKGFEMKVLEQFPDFFKFVMFWWCVLVFSVMTVFILDQLLFRWRGPVTVTWSKSFVFDGRASREAYWAQFVDPSAWLATHPILESADVRMVDFMSYGDSDAAAVADSASDQNEKEGEVKTTAPENEAVDEPTARLKPIKLQAFVPGLGLILRHKKDDKEREGLFFCSRQCTSLESPKDEPWRFEMKTVEAGVGHAFVPGSEVVVVVLHPTAEDGSIACQMSGRGDVTSRIWNWKMGLAKLSVEGAEAMLKVINDCLGKPKKED